jgi:uncharacterized Ntn-hydrolase superfamily protein
VTFSIAARSADGSTYGVAVASKFLAVGAVVPAACADVGALATQAWANLAYRPDGMRLLREGKSAQETLDTLVAGDEGRDVRQAGVVDAQGRSATYTGTGCTPWAGGLHGDGYAIQGNILTGEDVVLAMETAWQTSDPEASLARRLLEALAAGDQAGGDSRGRQSAALLVVKEGAGYGGLDDIAVDLRVDDHTEPIPELERLLTLVELYLTASTEEEKVPVTTELEEELEAFAHAHGARDFQAWVGTENYEMRVAPDLAWIDQKILDIVRSTPTKDS